MPIDSDKNSKKSNLFWSDDGGKTLHPFNPEPVTLSCSVEMSEEESAKLWAALDPLEIVPNV